VRTQTPEPAEDSQRRDLLSALGDDTHSAVLAQLAKRPCTQAQIAEATGIERSSVSRSLAHLRILGLIASGRGRDAPHEMLVEVELLELVAAADRLAMSVNERRGSAQMALSEHTARAAREVWVRRMATRSPSGRGPASSGEAVRPAGQ
jgi:DNA-binding transcriptional ArsR family regulator